jgi:hypothetical protein
MSVEKFVIRKEGSSFTIASNKVIDGLKSNLEILGLYLYFLSLPADWTFYKSKVSEECKVGIKKLNRMIKFLSECNLIEVVQHRGESGKFAHFDMCIKNGESFINIGFEENGRRKAKTVHTVSVPTVLTNYKRNIDKINIDKEYKNICASDDALAGFEDFKNLYPVRKNWYKAKEIWIKKKCYKLKDKIIDHVKNSIQRDVDWKKGIIPHPTTYLNQQRWDDEIKTQEAQGFQKPFHKTNELHSTVPEFVPDYTPINREAGMKGMEMIRKTLGIKSDAKARLNAPALSVGEIYGGGKG